MQLKPQEALTTWEYDLATGSELRKTYADGKGTVKTYDAYNNLATVTDARGFFATYTYNETMGQMISACYSLFHIPLEKK